MESHPAADVIGMGFHSEHGLGDAVAAHGTCGGPVGVNRPCVAIHILAGIGLGEAVQALGGNGVTMGGVILLICF